ncbi:phosphate/phosphite/phosphonate ABC transporter substrate-binding protein [Bdellovibrio sp. HCB337]|uniref:phosphate/phosphite/phosphonate ABC transporter substrate-binding protein n=1 Tax=Bdellovibrio sp. HCB337 TaxID=3394358 RepID=UPI0039A62236
MKKILLVLLSVLALTHCTSKSEIGTKENPIKISLVPGQDTKLLQENGKKLEAYLEEKTGLPFDVTVPVNFVAVIEALGSKRADMAIMNTFGYLLAHEKYGAEAALTGVHKGRKVYWGQVIARKDGPKSIRELEGKTIAFVDPSSGSGFVLPTKLLKDQKVRPKEVVFAGRHDSVVTMVYQKRVDAGATYHTPEDNGVPQDARKLLLTQYPDIFEKVVIIAKTDPIPNDPVVFRKDFPPELRKTIVEVIKKMMKDEQGGKIMYDLYYMDDFQDATHKDYESVEKMLLEIGKSAQDFVK